MAQPIIEIVCGTILLAWLIIKLWEKIESRW